MDFWAATNLTLAEKLCSTTWSLNALCPCELCRDILHHLHACCIGESVCVQTTGRQWLPLTSKCSSQWKFLVTWARTFFLLKQTQWHQMLMHLCAALTVPDTPTLLNCTLWQTGSYAHSCQSQHHSQNITLLSWSCLSHMRPPVSLHPVTIKSSSFGERCCQFSLFETSRSSLFNWVTEEEVAAQSTSWIQIQTHCSLCWVIFTCCNQCVHAATPADW